MTSDFPPTLREVSSGLWTLAGSPIKFATFTFELRSTLVDLGGALWVHSPVQLAAATPFLAQLGTVAHVVSPNKFHHLFMGEWARAFPSARLYAPPGLRKKRRDLNFAADLGDSPEPAWAESIDQRVVRGSLVMEEVVFFHRPSRSLILGDLIENHDPATFGPVQRAMARANAVVAPDGSTARALRYTFVRRAEARRAVREMISWNPERVIVTHGPSIEEGATDFLRRAFAWLL